RPDEESVRSGDRRVFADRGRDWGAQLDVRVAAGSRLVSVDQAEGVRGSGALHRCEQPALDADAYPAEHPERGDRRRHGRRRRGDHHRISAVVSWTRVSAGYADLGTTVVRRPELPRSGATPGDIPWRADLPGRPVDQLHR